MLVFILRHSLNKEGNKQYRIGKELRGFLRKNWYLPKTKGKPINLFQKFIMFWNQSALIIITIGGFYWLFFALSVKFIDIAIASIIIELWIVVFVIIHYFDKKDTKNLSKSIWILFMFALLGVIYITLSHTSINQPFSYKGLLLLMVCILLSATRVERSLKWAHLISKEWKKHQANEFDIHQNNMVSENWERIFILLSVQIGGISTIILIIFGNIFWAFRGNVWNLSFAPSSIQIFTNEIVISTTVAWVICIAGGFVDAIGIWNFREGNRDTPTLDVNGIYYLAPVLSLVWLFPFGLVQLQRWDYFVIGALIIMATSILIAIESDTGRLGFRWLIVSLWSTGLLIYFREKWIQWPWLSSDTPWEWGLETVDYYSLIVLSATVFILILSFRHNRLIERTTREENQYLRMTHLIKMLDIYHKNLYQCCKDALQNSLDKLDQFDTKVGGKIRNYFIDEIEARRADISPDKHADINKLELEFELLYRSKQRGRYLAENLVLYIFALVTIMVTIGTRPIATSAWNALMIDILAFLFSAAICFMTINLIDLRAYREKSTVELRSTEEEGERDKDAINQKAVQVIAIILAVVISMSFVILLYDKWMGIWFL